MNDSFQLELVYNASLTKVWKTLTDVELMRIWYFPQIKHFDLKVGNTFSFVDDGSAYKKEWKITKLENNRLMSHSWVYEGYPGYSEVTFELFKEGKMTVFRLTHTGLASFPADPNFAYKRFERGWNMILGQNFRQCLENQTG